MTWERLVSAADEPQNWLMYNGTLDSKRFSSLDQIDRGNVDELELKWAHHIPQLDRAETTPLVVDGVMFITESPSNVVAVDAVTGAALVAGCREGVLSSQRALHTKLVASSMLPAPV